jgi:hypothetical protein
MAWTVEVSDEPNWYTVNLRKADAIYDAHLREIQE